MGVLLAADPPRGIAIHLVAMAFDSDLGQTHLIRRRLGAGARQTAAPSRGLRVTDQPELIGNRGQRSVLARL